MLVAAILGSSIAYVDESVVNVALPAIGSDLHAPLATMQWVVNAYTLFLSALILVGGGAGDQFGRRRIFVIGLAVFAAASLCAGLAPTAGLLVLARALQGVGGAFLIPSGLAIIGAAFEEPARSKAIGTWAGISAIAAALGPLLGGWLIDRYSWRAIFLINPPLALLTLCIALRHIPESRNPDAPPGIDWLGGLLGFAGLGGIVFGLIESAELDWRAPAVLLPIFAGMLSLAGFIWVERRSAAPMMPPDLFRSRTFSGVNLLTLLLYGALGGAFFLVPFDLIRVQGYSATLTGAAFLPFTLVVGALSRASGALLQRIDVRWSLSVGPAIAAGGLALLALPGVGGSYWITFFPAMIVLGIGMAITIAPLTSTVMDAVDPHRTGVASGINNAVASVAALLAVAIFGAIALQVFDRALDRRLASTSLSAATVHALEGERGKLGSDGALTTLPDGERQAAELAVAQSLATGFRVVMAIAAALALAGAFCAAVLIRSSRKPE